MKSFKAIVNICINSFRQWMTNYRIWCIGLLIILLIHLFTSEIRDFVIMTDTKITPYIFPFFFTQKYIRLLFLFPLTLLHCDAPFVNSIQKYIIVRAGRKKWIISQIMYIVCSSFVYFTFIIFFSIVINLPYMTFDTEWGKVINTLYRTDAASQIGLKLVMTGNIPEYFSPFQSMYFSFLLLSMSGIFIGLIICCVNTFSKNRAFGVLMASVFLIVDAVICKGP